MENSGGWHKGLRYGEERRETQEHSQEWLCHGNWAPTPCRARRTYNRSDLLPGLDNGCTLPLVHLPDHLEPVCPSTLNPTSKLSARIRCMKESRNRSNA